MNFQSLFAGSNKKAKSPTDLVRGLKEAVQRLETGPSGSEGRKKASDLARCLDTCLTELVQANEEVSKILYAMKLLLFGEGGASCRGRRQTLD
jgi:hypothetical protein